jgi:hypothetical protein
MLSSFELPSAKQMALENTREDATATCLLFFPPERFVGPRLLTGYLPSIA